MGEVKWNHTVLKCIFHLPLVNTMKYRYTIPKAQSSPFWEMMTGKKNMLIELKGDLYKATYFEMHMNLGSSKRRHCVYWCIYFDQLLFYDFVTQCCYFFTREIKGRHFLDAVPVVRPQPVRLKVKMELPVLKVLVPHQSMVVI